MRRLVIAGALVGLFMVSPALCQSNNVDRQIARAIELAGKMGMSIDPQNYKNLMIRTEGFVPTEINGVLVPFLLLTEEERKSVESARRIRALMGN